jgi:hypothetical protein
VNEFTDHLYPLLGTASNCRAISNLHTLQITTAPTKPFSSHLCLHHPFPSNGFYQWRFFSLPRLGPVFTVSHAETNSQVIRSLRLSSLYSKTCLKWNLKGPEYFSTEARFPFNASFTVYVLHPLYSKVLST